VFSIKRVERFKTAHESLGCHSPLRAFPTVSHCFVSLSLLSTYDTLPDMSRQLSSFKFFMILMTQLRRCETIEYMYQHGMPLIWPKPDPTGPGKHERPYMSGHLIAVYERWTIGQQEIMNQDMSQSIDAAVDSLSSGATCT
jgi:hypothetical protein